MGRYIMKRLIIVTLVSLSLWALAACSVSFNIHFDSNGGSDVASIETSGTGTIRLPNDPVKEGYVFDGWYWDNNTFQQPFTANSLLDAPLSNNLTVYARWRNPLEDSNTGLLRVRFMNAGDVSVEPVFVQPGSAITPPLVSKEGHTLRGWYTSINQGQTLDERWSFSTNLVNSNIDLYPDWEVNQYTITLDTSGGDGQTSVQQDFDSIIIIDDPMKEGHTFIGWSPELPEKMPSRSLAVTAQWVINQYTISFDSDGVVSLAAITQDFNSDIDEPVVLERIGYEFLGWFLDENADSPFIFDKVPARDINLKARWEAIEFTINYELNDGENTSNPNTRTIETSEIVLEDPIKEGHAFIGWFDNEDLTGTAITVISQGLLEDIVLHAKWERIPTIPTISGVDSITVMVGDEFDPLAGVSASDEIDGSLTSSITVSGEVDTATVGTYTLKYRVENAAGLSREVSRKVIVHNDMDTDDSESDDVEDSDSNDGEQEELLLTLQELSEFDGRDGRRALIAVDGIIYEVTGSPRWPNGNHNGYQAGQDLTQFIDQISPHGRLVLDRLPRVGRIFDDAQGK